MRALISFARPLLAAAFALAGCGEPSGSPDMLQDLAVKSTDMARTIRDLAKLTAAAQGVLRDENGDPLDKTSVLCCSTVECKYATTNPDGSFSCDGLLLGPLVLKTEHELDKSPKHAAAFCPIILDKADVTLDAKDMYVPFVSTTSPLPAGGSPTPVNAGDGVALTMVGSDIELPLGFEKEKYVGARMVPEERRSKSFDTGGEKVAAAFALIPFGTGLKAGSKSTIGVKAPVDLPAGSAVNFRTYSNENGTADPAVAGHVDQDGKTASTDPGQGVTRLTWLLITTK